MTRKKINYTKVALALSICLLIVWGVLGTGTSLAWFSDTTPTHRNTLLVGDLDMEVYHRLDNGDYETVDYTTSVFNDQALYEPGYVQTVILKVVNEGDVPFDYRLSVNVNDVTIAQSVMGNDIYLPNYLRYGVMFAATEDELVKDLNRELAEIKSPNEFPQEPASGSYPLNMFSEIDEVTVPVGGERYIALIVRMPSDVGNAANYRGTTPPTIKLGITVMASQEGTLF